MAKAKTASTGQAQPAPDPAPDVQFDADNGVRWVELRFDGEGYPGWWARVRVNPRTRDWELLFFTKKPGTVWQGLAGVVLEWNFTMNGGPMPLPGAGLALDDFPRDLIVPLVTRTIAATLQAVAVPKG